MSRKPRPRGRFIPVLFFTFVAGIALGWWGGGEYRAGTTAQNGADLPLPSGTSGDVNLTPKVLDRSPQQDTSVTRTSTTADPDALSELSDRHLRLPIDGADVRAMKGQFGETREGGARGHEAVDVLAPRGTPVRAVEDGTIEKLFLSKQGGITVYQFDPSRRFCYYYAHLDRYAPGLHEKQKISRGDLVGFVGTTGNAPANTPHLHFAIFQLTSEKHWWQGTPIDPWTVFSR